MVYCGCGDGSIRVLDRTGDRYVIQPHGYSISKVCVESRFGLQIESLWRNNNHTIVSTGCDNLISLSSENLKDHTFKTDVQLKLRWKPNTFAIVDEFIVVGGVSNNLLLVKGLLNWPVCSFNC